MGKDQEQHLELSRNIAVRFNNQFGTYFPEPAPLFTEVPKLMSLADPEKKMSKSLGDKHYIGVFEAEDSIRKKIRSAVTDTGMTGEHTMSPGVENLFAIIKACDREDVFASLKDQYGRGILKYKELKDVTSDVLVEKLKPLSVRRTELGNDRATIENLIREQSSRARDFAERTLDDVKKLTGLIR